MVHQDFNALRVSILVQHLDIEIGVWGYKVEYITLPHISPVLPTYVPTFNQYLVEAVLGSKVDIALYLLVVSGMATIGFNLVPVNLVEFNAGVIVGIVP